MVSLKAMQIFIAVVRHGSLSSAARQLGMSTASVSRQIHAMEDALGARVLNRTSRELTLTEAGDLYFEQAEYILRQVDEAHHSIAQLQQAPHGMLRVHSRILVGELFLLPALSRFLKQYPGITVDLMLSNRVIDLVAQNVDIDIRIGALADSQLIARRLTLSQRILCAAPEYLASSPPLRTPADLVHHNCLTFRLNKASVQWRFLAPDGQSMEIAVNGSLRSDSGPSLRLAALEGLGIAMLPDWSVRQDLQQGRLQQLFPDHQASFVEFDNGVYAMYQRSRHQSAKVRLLVDFLSQEFDRFAGRLPASDKQPD